jgi:hypothetical protein
MTIALTIFAIAVVFIAHIAAWRMDQRIKRATITRFDFQQKGRSVARTAWKNAA